jgi:hypothetical protein
MTVNLGRSQIGIVLLLFKSVAVEKIRIFCRSPIPVWVPGRGWGCLTQKDEVSWRQGWLRSLRSNSRFTSSSLGLSPSMACVTSRTLFQVAAPLLVSPCLEIVGYSPPVVRLGSVCS